MSKVHVLIVKTEPGSTDNNIQKLKNIFSNPFFSVNIISVTPPHVINKTKDLSNYDIITLNRIKKSLIFTNKNSINIPILIILDTSITYETASTMKKNIENIFNLDYDILYLCKWYDDCQALEKTNYPNIFKTKKPKGFQAALFSNKMRNLILSEEFDSSISFSRNIEQFILNNKIIAYSFVPNIINFDIEFAKIDEEYLKLNECAPITNRSPNEGITYIWFIFMIILIIAVAWAVIKLGPDQEDQKEIL